MRLRNSGAAVAKGGCAAGMWADNETTLDLLGFRVHADLVRSVVTDPGLLPITIGVFGDWGGGKTSVMKMLQADLEPAGYEEGSPERERYEGVACLYFNGWLFEGYDDAKSAILSSVLLQLAAHQRFGPKVGEKATSLLQSVNWMRLARLGFKEVALPAALAYLTGGTSLLPALVDPLKKLFGAGDAKTGDGTEKQDAGDKVKIEDFIKPGGQPEGPMDVRTFRDRFSEMLSESDIESLVILIDDLDRCSPQRIIDNLEAIKLFLSVDRTAFVIGADPRIVRHAIATVYDPAETRAETDEHEDPTDLVTDYLEKVIQVPYRLPRLSPSEVETYMSLLFCHRELDTDEFSGLRAAYERHREEDRYTVFGYGAIRQELGERFEGELAANLAFCRSAAPLITEGLKGNPRQVKRFLNAFVLRKRLADVAKLTNVRDDILVKLMILEYAHSRQFNQLHGWQSGQDGHPEELRRLEEALASADANGEQAAKEIHEEWGSTFVRRWVTMEPALTEVDLRDYFWVARDRLQSTLSEASLVPPLVRRLVEDLLSGNPGRLSKGASRAEELEADDLGRLYGLVERHAQRHPDQQEGYDALLELMRKGMPGSGAALSRALLAAPPEAIPPAIGLDILTLLKDEPGLHEELDSALNRLRRDTKSMIGRALKQNAGNRGGRNGHL